MLLEAEAQEGEQGQLARCDPCQNKPAAHTKRVQNMENTCCGENPHHRAALTDPLCDRSLVTLPDALCWVQYTQEQPFPWLGISSG